MKKSIIKKLISIAACAVVGMTSMVGTVNINASATDDYDIEINEDIQEEYSEALLNSINGWATTLWGISDFGSPKDYSSYWYANLSDVDILSRLIYAESTTANNYSVEQIAVTWILINRVNSNLGFGSTLRDVATQQGQFSSITGGYGATNNARNPVQSSDAWRHAVWMACAILSTSSTYDYMWLFGKPNYINNQLFFYASSLATFSTSSGILTINGVLATDAAYAGVTSVTTSSTGYAYASTTRNIYYNYY